MSKKSLSLTQKKDIIFFWFKITLFVLFIAMILVTSGIAFGYKLDFNKHVFTKTSIISLEGRGYEDAEVYLDEKLVGDTLPMQIYSIDPKRHQLAIEKTGFLNWEKDFTLKEDIVSKFIDILLIPENTAKYERYIKAGEGGLVDSFENQLLFYNEKAGFYKLLDLNNINNEFEVFDSFTSNPVSAELIAKNLMKIDFGDNRFKIVDFRDMSVKYLPLNKDFKLINFLSSSNEIYFIFEDSLYFAHINENGGINTKTLIQAGVDYYTISDDVVFFTNGKNLQLYKHDLLNQFDNITIKGDLSTPINKFKIKEIDNGYLLFSDPGEIYMITDLNELKLIKNNIKKYDLKDDKLLITDGTDILICKNISNPKFDLITRYNSEILDVKFYKDERHFLLITDNTLRVSETDGDNIEKLVQIDEGSRITLINNTNDIVFKRDTNYYSLSF